MSAGKSYTGNDSH